MILDAKSDPQKVAVLLTRLQARMDALSERAATFKNYQKNFKVYGRATAFITVRIDLVANIMLNLRLQRYDRYC